MLSEKQKEFLDMVVYQIYPKSFKDTNNDGIGDINGIIEKLDYIKELGANAIWLTPCYKSPNVDNGYDIADYCDISEDYGTLEDWKRLKSEMEKRDMKLIMDFVANHTSSEHKWFKEARKSKDNPYRDYYYWADEPLNDWVASFGGSAWEYDETTNQYYLHSYAVEQPDLNWENPKVREKMIKVIDFWVDLGVDGFRCDVLDQISKDFEKGEIRNGPRLHEYIKMLFGREKTANIFTVGECWGADKDNIKLFVDGDRQELSTVFQFEHLRVGRKTKFEPLEFELDELRDIMVKWQNLMQDNELLQTLFYENHDTNRVLSRLGKNTEHRYEKASMLGAMLFLQRGIPFIYQGQEFGTTNSDYDSIDSFNDIETLNFYNANKDKIEEKELISAINFGSRDNGRHPMAWNDSENGGFGKGKPWITLYSDYKNINAEKDINSEKSIYKFYKDLFELRKTHEAFRRGSYEDLTDGRNGLYIYSRTLDNEKYVVVCNFDKESDVDFPGNAQILLSNNCRTEANGTYQPYECAIIKMN